MIEGCDMTIKINGTAEEVQKESLTVSELLEIKEVQNPEAVSVEYNGEYLDRESFTATVLKEGDEIEFLYFMGGGAQRGVRAL